MKKNSFFKIQILAVLSVFFFSASAQISNVTNSHIGNSFNGANDKWVQNYADELDVASDGTMITASAWDEAGRCVGVFKDGQPVALLKTPFSSDCWGFGTSTEAVAVDDNYLYVNNCKGDIMRFNRNSNYDYVDKVNTGVAFGMTHSEGFLYMIQANGLVQKRSVSNIGTVALSFTVAGGSDLAVDAAGSIWVLTTDKEVLKYTTSGANTGVKIAAQIGWKPKAVNYDAFNDVLLVSDNGPLRQVIKFNTSGSQVGAFGDEGGISSGAKGTVGDLRFWNISGSGTDANGNVYVALNENCVSLRKFNASGVKQWEVLGTMFTDIASIDPASDGNDMYTINEHLKFNYSTQQWSMAAMTVDAIGNPTDPRNVEETGTDITSAVMRRVNGNLLMYTTGMYADEFYVYRFVGEVAVFCQAFSGTGWAGLPDKDGNIWYEDVAIKKIPLTGFLDGVPVFGTPVVVAAGPPAPIEFIERLEYDVDKDVMYIGGYTETHPSDAWGLVGSTLARYPNWSTGNRTASHTTILPKDIGGFYPKAMSVANDYIFVTGSRDRGKTYVINSSDLSSTGYIDAPTDIGFTGWIDIPHGIQAFKKSNGQYVILVEDNYRGKNILYQWCPSGSCDTGGGPVQSVAISPETYSIKQATKYQLTALFTPYNADNRSANWTSSNAAVATVNSLGLVSGISPGTATITITTLDGGKIATADITVTPAFNVQRADGALYIDGKVEEGEWNLDNLIAKPTFGAQNNEGYFDLLWDENYLYVGLTVKDSKVMFSPTKNPWENDAIEIYIDGNQNKATSYDEFDVQLIQVTGSDAIWSSRAVSGIHKSVAFIDGGYSMELAIPWSIINSSAFAGAGLGFDIAYDDNDTGSRDGTTTWFGDGNNYNNTSKFDDLLLVAGTPSSIAVTSIVIDSTSVSVLVGDTRQLTATASPINAANKNFLWSASNASIATINQTGLISAIAPGESIVSVKTVDGNFQATCLVKSISNITSNDEDAGGNINMYPNPVTEDKIYLSGISGSTSVKITDALGKVMYLQTVIVKGILEIDELNLKPGFYFLSIEEKRVFKVIVK